MPLNYFFISIILLITSQMQAYTIMLCPACDTQTVGRTINGSFERGISFQFIDACKKLLRERAPHVQVLIAHKPGETIAPLQTANFANRAQIDLFMQLHFYHDTAALPQIFIYHYGRNDAYRTGAQKTLFLPFDDAHLAAYADTKQCAQQFATILSGYPSLCHAHAPRALPLAPLLGITAPALCIEIGIAQHDTWRTLVDPFVSTIIAQAPRSEEIS